MRGGWLLAASTAALGSAWEAGAIDLDRLVMPGPVIEAHVRWEKECSQCHRPLERGGQDALCLDCHDAVRADREGGTGFHGRSPAVEAAEACRSCHPEHRGRDAEVTGLVDEIFQHRYTDFGLDGAHTSVPCASCHPADTLHREAPLTCVGCHRADDPHGDALDDDCAQCHVTASWHEARFDHDETRFPLRGAHDAVACVLCHPGPDPAAAPTDCVGCHRLDDAHRGSLGSDCARCHGTVAWKSSRFDHDRDTDFPLEGAHAEATCAACHTEPPERAETSTRCVSCHQGQDVHAGRNGPECETCHVATTWSEPRFDHAADTGFALEGAHASLRCAQCHGTSLEGLPHAPGCVDCHRGDDVHGGSLTERCDRCHGNVDWSHPIVFEHDVARFPLLGLHATAPCEQCHVSRRFDSIEPRCETCHAAEDVHEGGLGGDCGRCHGPNGWPYWEFDHGAETAFALHGAHEDLACSACHPAGGFRTTEGRCVVCHAADDAHFGAFGDTCEACHVDEDWRFIRRRR